MRLSVAINPSVDGCEKQNKWHANRKKAHGAQVDIGGGLNPTTSSRNAARSLAD